MTKTTTNLYKQTPLGLIPSDWEVKKLGKLGTIVSGLTYSPDDICEEKGVLVLRSSNVQSGRITFDDNVFVKVNNGDFNPVKKNDILICVRNGSKSLIGKCALVKADAEGMAFGAFMAIFRGDYNDYLIHVFNTDIYNKEIHRNLGATINSINGSDLKEFKIPLPPLPEQKAIAHVLSTADAAIQTTEKLIAQKEQRKKWLMQQLLTGKKRLLNDELGIMNDEWKPIRIGDVFKFIKSFSISREGLQNDDNGSVFCIHYGDIHAKYNSSFLDFDIQKNIPQLIDESISIEENNFLKDGDIVMADASEDYEGVGAAVEIKNLNGKKAIGGLHTLVLRADKKTISPDFAAYFFSSEKVRNTLRKYATGTSVYSVTKTQIHNLSFIIPNSLKEQTAIAQVLQAADKEINLLKTKATKLREQKKGLMQQLLTGKKRLNQNFRD